VKHQRSHDSDRRHERLQAGEGGIGFSGVDRFAPRGQAPVARLEDTQAVDRMDSKVQEKQSNLFMPLNRPRGLGFQVICRSNPVGDHEYVGVNNSPPLNSLGW